MSTAILIIVLASCKNPDTMKAVNKKNTEIKPDSSTGIVYLPVNDFLDLYSKETKQSAMLIDLRTPPEYQDGYIPGAVMINFLDAEFDHQLSLLNKNTRYYIYCQQGGRTDKCIPKLKALGFQNVYLLKGGYEAFLKNKK